MRSRRLLLAFSGLVTLAAFAGAAETPPALGTGLRQLDWWHQTDVLVEKLETYEQSEEALQAALPSSNDSLAWYALGPIPGEGKSHHYRSYPPEEHVDVTATVTVADQQLAWRRLHPPEKTGSGLNLNSELKASRGGLAYLYRELIVEEPTDTRFFLGFYRGCRVWLNGEELFFSDSGAYNDSDRVELPVHLQAGVNRVLVKSFSPSSSWYFYFHTGSVNPRRARIKGRWLLAELYPEEPDRQLSARLAVVRELLELRDDPSLRAAGELVAELAATGPVTKELLETAQRVARAAQDRGRPVEAERAWTLALRLVERTSSELRSEMEPGVLEPLAASRGRVGDIRGAERVYRRLVTTYPAHQVTAEALWPLAEFYRREGRTWLALPYYQQLLAGFPESKRAEAAGAALDWCRKFTGDRPRRKGSFSAAQLLAQGARREEDGDPEGALRLYLDTLAQWSEEFVRVDDDRVLSVPLIVGERARALWSELSPEAQEQVGTAEDRALREAEYTGLPDDLPRVLRRHPLAPSAPRVLAAWAARMIEAGRVGRAAVGLTELLREYRLSPRPRAQAAAQLAFCAQLLRGPLLAAASRTELEALPAGTTATWAGRETPVGDVLAGLGPEAPATVPAPRLGEVAPRPRTVRLLPDQTGRQLLNPHWPTPRAAVPWRPLAADGCIYCYDQQAARAFTAGGDLVWRSWPHRRALRGVKGRGFKGLPAYLASADERRLYTLQLGADDVERATRSDLFAYDRATGQVLWSTEKEEALADYQVCSPPLIAFDRLYALAYSTQVLGDELLLALDPESGRLLGSTLVATGNGKLKVFSSSYSTSEYDARSLAPPPVADERRLYLATQVGAVVAVSAFSGEVDWVLEYPRTSLTSTDDAFMVNYVCRGLSAPLLADDLLLVVPRDSAELLAIDRVTGELRWRRSEHELSELWGVASPGEGQGAEAPPLVVTSDVRGELLAYGLATGELRWSWRPPTGRPGQLQETKAGRGLLMGDRVLVPTGAGLYELALADGTQRGFRSLPEPRRELSGLVATTEGLVAGWEEGLLFWPTDQTTGADLDETVVQAAVRAGPEPPTSAVAIEPVPTEWAPVAPVAGSGAVVAILPAEGGEDVVSYDGRWLSFTQVRRRPELRWRRALAGDVPFVRANSRLVVAAAGPELVALERETGTELWRWSIPVQAGGYGIFDGTSRSFKALQVTETLVLVGLYRSVWALDVETGRERWHYGLEYDLQDVSVDSEFVYAVTTYYRGYLRTYALSPQDGRPRQTAEYRGLDARNLFVVLDGRRLWVVEQAHRRITAYDIAQAAQLWQEPNPNLNQPEFLGQDDRRLFLRVEMPRGKAPRLLAVDRMAGAQAFMVEDASFQSALKPPGQQSTFSAGAVPRPYLVVPGADVGLEAEAVLLVQQGTDLTAWPAYQPEPARRWSLFEEKELLNSITRRGRYLFLATVRPFSEELEGAKETPSALVQPTMRLVELPEGTVSATVSLPGVSVGVPSQSLIPVEHGLLHLGPAGLSFLAPVSREEAAEELHALRASSDLGRSERALLETLIAGLAPVELVARPCRPDFQVEVDGTLEEWSAVPAVRFGPKEEGWSELFPEIAEPRPPAAVPLAGGIRLAWDESWLYLAVEVDDELHRPNWAEGASWRSDALILRVLPTVHTLGLRKSLSLTVAGPIGRRRLEERTGGARASVHLGIGRQEGVTTYEVAVARSSLVSGELWPPPAGEFRMMLALTDRDDSGLREMLVFPPGPHSDRELDSLATVSFAQPPGEEP